MRWSDSSGFWRGIKQFIILRAAGAVMMRKDKGLCPELSLPGRGELRTSLHTECRIERMSRVWCG